MSTQEALEAGPVPPEEQNPQGSLSPSSVKQEPDASISTNGKIDEGNQPAEICVVIGGSRSLQNQSSYICGICGKKYKYYNCFQTHVLSHKESDGSPRGGVSPAINNSFRYSCDICGKKYKYYSCFQEHRDLHAVDDPYDHVIIPVEDLKEEPIQTQTSLKIGPKTGSYVCEFCGKQYKYFNPYQEHVALHTPMGRPFQVQLQQSSAQRPHFQPHSVDAGKYSSSSSEHIDSDLSRKLDERARNISDADNLQNSSGTTSSQAANSFPAVQKPYTCGACGIEFQFYNNLLEHMQSHAADNENHSKVELKISCTAQEQEWNIPLQTQRNNNAKFNSTVPEKERQIVAERLLKLMCMDLGALNILKGKEFLKLAQTLVDSGAQYGAYSLQDAFGDMSQLALRQLPRMYNQVKVKVTCALGSSASLGLAVTCHSQMIGADTFCVLSAYQVEGVRLKRYILGVKEVEHEEAQEQLHHWVQNVLSEFVMSEVCTVYVTEQKVLAVPFCGRPGMCLRCACCSVGDMVEAVLGKKSLQTRGLQELVEVLATCREITAAPNYLWEIPENQPAPPACWNQTAEALLKVHQHFDKICEIYGRSKDTASLLQNLNKPLLGTLASMLDPLRQVVVELNSEQQPTLQAIWPRYIRLEKLFTSKASEAGVVAKLCHFFLEALKENFRMEPAHQAAMILDPQQKLRLVPTYQHDEVIGKVCEAAATMKGVTERDNDQPPEAKQRRNDDDDAQAQQQVRLEVFQYLAESSVQATPDLFHYWSSAMGKFPRLARLALWLLAVPAIAVHGDCVAICEHSAVMKRRKEVTCEEMNKLIFLKANMV